MPPAFYYTSCKSNVKDLFSPRCVLPSVCPLSWCTLLVSGCGCLLCRWTGSPCRSATCWGMSLWRAAPASAGLHPTPRWSRPLQRQRGTCWRTCVFVKKKKHFVLIVFTHLVLGCKRRGLLCRWSTHPRWSWGQERLSFYFFTSLNVKQKHANRKPTICCYHTFWLQGRPPAETLWRLSGCWWLAEPWRTHGKFK